MPPVNAMFAPARAVALLKHEEVLIEQASLLAPGSHLRRWVEGELAAIRRVLVELGVRNPRGLRLAPTDHADTPCTSEHSRRWSRLVSGKRVGELRGAACRSHNATQPS